MIFPQDKQETAFHVLQNVLANIEEHYCVDPISSDGIFWRAQYGNPAHLKLHKYPKVDLGAPLDAPLNIEGYDLDLTEWHVRWLGQFLKKGDEWQEPVLFKLHFWACYDYVHKRLVIQIDEAGRKTIDEYHNLTNG